MKNSKNNLNIFSKRKHPFSILKGVFNQFTKHPKHFSINSFPEKTQFKIQKTTHSPIKKFSELLLKKNNKDSQMLEKKRKSTVSST